MYYQLDYVVNEVLKDMPSREQSLLKNYSKQEFSKKEAAYLWERITDHKWYIGERLKRDVGFHVATVDYLENFYEPNSFFKNNRHQSNGVRRILNSASSALRNYFVSKSRVVQL